MMSTSTTTEPISTIQIDHVHHVHHVDTTVNVNPCKVNDILEEVGKKKRKHQHHQHQSTTSSPTSPASPTLSFKSLALSSNVDHHHHLDRFNLVRFADALRLYVRHYLVKNNLFRNQNFVSRFGTTTTIDTTVDTSNTRNTTPRFVSMNLYDVKSHLQRVVNINTSSIKKMYPKHSSSLSTKTNKTIHTLQHIHDIIQQLCQLLPEWISLSSSPSSSSSIKRLQNTNSSSSFKKITNLTMVRICNSIPYQSIREKLGVPSRRNLSQMEGSNNIYYYSHNSNSLESNGCTGTSSTTSTTSTTFETKEEEEQRHDEDYHHHHHLEKKRKNETIINSNTTTSTSTRIFHNNNDNDDSNNHHQNFVKKRKVDDHDLKDGINMKGISTISSHSASLHHNHLIEKDNNETTKYDHMSTHDKDCKNDYDDNFNIDKDEDDDNDPVSLLRATGMEQTIAPTTPPKLRINQNQYMTNADYNGGEVIPSKLITSPRALKRLFSRLNAGERI